MIHRDIEPENVGHELGAILQPGILIGWGMDPDLTNSGRSPVAGSHNLPDHWEHKNVLVLHGKGNDEPVLRICIRGKPQGNPGDSTWVDLKARDAERFAKTVFVIAGYEVAGRARRDQPKHCSLYQARGRSRLHTYVCIWHHGSPVRARATHELPMTKILALADWLAPRMGWILSEAA